jgi:thymidylate synthase (FAD)
MGKIVIQEHTTKNPVSLIGEEAGICYGANTSDPIKNYKRGLECLKNQHGRTLEFPTVYMILDGYSARVIREFYTHIGGAPTRLQASTRYIEYGKFEYITPPTIEKNESANKLYDSIMSLISTSIQKLEEAGVPKEDTANLLPLGMTTKVVCKINLRTLIDMSHQRMCVRAYWEFRQLFRDIRRELKDYSEEWSYLVDIYFEPKCDYLGYCPEKFTCGKMNPKETTSAN